MEFLCHIDFEYFLILSFLSRLFFLIKYVLIFTFCCFVSMHTHTHSQTCIRIPTHTLTQTNTFSRILIFSHTHMQSHCRLCAARDMSLSMSSGAETDPRSNGEDETVGEMDVVLESTPSGEVISSTQRHKNSSSKPPYQAFLGQLYALIEGAIDSNRLVCTHINSFTHSPPPSSPSFNFALLTTFTFLFPHLFSFCLPNSFSPSLSCYLFNHYLFPNPLSTLPLLYPTLPYPTLPYQI